MFVWVSLANSEMSQSLLALGCSDCACYYLYDQPPPQNSCTVTPSNKMVPQLQRGVAFPQVTNSTILLWGKKQTVWSACKGEKPLMFLNFLLPGLECMITSVTHCGYEKYISQMWCQLVSVCGSLYCFSSVALLQRTFLLSFLHGLAFSRFLQVLCTLAVLLHFFLSGFPDCFLLLHFSFALISFLSWSWQ